jgi:vancomycin resistance protein VanJ
MANSRTSRLVHCSGFAFLTFSAVLWLITTVCFIAVWDHVAAITTFPQWSWAFIGIFTALLAWRLLKGRTRLPLLMLAVWLVTTLAFADNLFPLIRGLVRGTIPQTHAPDGALRVVTLNCASSAAAAREITRFNPDLVLLQEAPSSNQIAQVAREWFGKTAFFLIGLDCSIISKYPLQPLEARPAAHYTQAFLKVPSKRELLVTSLRLTPPLGAMDLWTPATWRAYLEDRRLRKRQLRSALEAEFTVPEIIGGDFNAPAGDGIYKLLTGYRDAHKAAGRGWGNTALNTIPLFRPDQIWLKGITAVSCYALQTDHSDHRMIIADVRLD